MTATTAAFSLVLILGNGPYEVVQDPRPMPKHECTIRAEDMTGAIAVLSNGSKHFVWLAACRPVPSATVTRIG